VSGAGIWQEEGKPPVTLKAGDSLFVPAGTIHSHWNPSPTDPLRFLEFIVAEKDKGRSIHQPGKDWISGGCEYFGARRPPLEKSKRKLEQS
jgi:quercetin dioxygenase-like cupin family protein